MSNPAMFVALERRLTQEGHDDLRLGFAAFGAGFATYAGEMWRLTFGMRKRICFSCFLLGQIVAFVSECACNSEKFISCCLVLEYVTAM